MQQQHSLSGTYVSRRAFKELVMLWLTIVFFTFAGAIILTISKAKADIVLSMPLLTRVSEPAIIKSFDVSPTSVMIGTRCQNLLSPNSGGHAVIQPDNRTRRAAGDLATVTVAPNQTGRVCTSREDVERPLKTSMR